ncbi:MAG: MGMT family protein, partial [Planctomycetales bacterium]|nr:MGMT family protein [Planctomycetales bacterium]
MRELPAAVADWVDLLSAYAAGERVSLQRVPVANEHLTPFGRVVARACRSIRYGDTRSYGELAQLAGRPGAARAVGSVMAKNR